MQKNEKKEIQNLKEQVKQVKKLRTGIRGGSWEA